MFITGEKLTDQEVDDILKYTETKEDMHGDVRYEGQYVHVSQKSQGKTAQDSSTSIVLSTIGPTRPLMTRNSVLTEFLNLPDYGQISGQ